MILDNKLGITNQAELSREGEKLSKKRAKEMFEWKMCKNLARLNFKKRIKPCN